MEWFKAFLQYAFTPAVVVGGIAWLSRSIISHSLTKDLEQYKAELQNVATENAIRYQALHAKRAEVIEKMYSLSVDTELAFTRYVSPFQLPDRDEEKQRREAADAGNDLNDYYSHNRLFFEESIAKNIDKITQQFKETWHKFHASQRDNQQNYKLWNEAWNNIEGPIKKSKKTLENEFRRILGIRK